MPEKFNPYCQWLGLDPDTTKPSHYELLGLPAGESDTKKIAVAAEQAATKVRSFRPGAQATHWARLLDEIQEAKLILLDSARKAQYDRKLKADGIGSRRAAAEHLGASAAAPKPASPIASDLYPPGFRPAGKAVDLADAQEPVHLPTHAVPVQPEPAAAPLDALPPSPSLHSASVTPAATAGYGTAWPAAYPAQVAAPVPAAYPPSGYSPAAPPGYGTPVAQPVGFPAAMAGHYPFPVSPMGVPVAMPMPAGVTSQPYGVATAAMPYALAAPIDPMAPVAIPGVTAQPMAAPAMAAGAPMGTAVAAASPAALPTSPPDSSSAAAPHVSKASAASVMMAARKDKQTRNAALLVGAAAGLVVVAGLAAYAVITSRLSDTGGDAEVAKVIDKNQTNDGGGTKQGTVSNAVLSPGSGGKSKTGDDDALRPKETAGYTRLTPRPMVEPAPVPGPQPEPQPEPMPSPTPVPTPTPKPAPMPTVKPTRQQVVDLEAALKRAKVALGEHTFDEAEAEVGKAEKLALVPDQQEMVERLRLAVDHVKLFREALSQAASQLEAAETIKVGSSTVVAIVETFPDKIIVRVSGTNRTYPFAEIPPGLAVAILDVKRIGGNPDSRVLKALYVATRKGADEDAIAQARGWLAEAQASDENAAELLKFLDDSYESLVKEFDEAEKSAAASAKTANVPN